jgi:uncharacterized protein
MKTFSFQNILNRMLGRPVAVILVICAITGIFAWHIPQLSFRTSIYDLIIEELPDTARYQRFKKQFGSDEIIRVVIKSKTLFEPETFRHMAQFAEKAANIKGISRVISLPGIKKDMDPGNKWSPEKFAAMIAPVKLFQRNLLSDDRKTTAVTLIIKTGAHKNQVIDNVNELMAAMPKSLSVYQIGMPLVSRALAQFTEKDFFRLPPFTLVLIGFILFFLFRNIACLFLPLLTVLISLIWTLGLMAWTQIPLSLLTMIVPVFLIAVGTAYCLYICSEYITNARQTDHAAQAVFMTFSNITFPTLLAVFTTVIGLGSLLVNRITAIREFALFAGFGMFSLMVILMTFFPAVLTLMPISKIKRRGKAPASRLLTSILDRIVRVVLYHQKVTFALTAVIILFCIVGIFRIKAETNPLNYFKNSTDIAQDFHDIYKDLSGSFPINVVVTGNGEDYFENPESITRMASLQTFLESIPGVDKSISFADYIKLVNYAMNHFEPDAYALPEEKWELSMAMNNYKSMLGDDMFFQFVNSDLSQANILLLTHLSSSRDFLELREKIKTHVARHFPKNFQVEVTGFGMVISASSHLLVNGQIKSLSISIFLVFLIMLALFLSGKVGLVAIFTSLFPIVVNFGIMGWMGIELSMATSLIASIAIGLAVDDTIHYLIRYSHEFKKDLDKDRALHDTIKHVGKPILFTTLTISIGFSILIFSHFKLTAIFGMLMVITMISALVGDLILLPSLMLHVELVTAWDLLRLMPTPGGIPPAIVHELNQPLNAIKMGGEFMKMILDKGNGVNRENLVQVTREITTQVDRAAAIINRLEPLGHKPGFKKEAVNINRPVRNTMAIIAHQLKIENISVALELDETLPSVQAHENRLTQVIFNLIDNARDAVVEKRRLDLDPDDTSIIIIRTYRKKDRVALSISDPGTGIPIHMTERIYEPFFTTKEAGKGKGLGLSISNEIIRAYGGKIHAKTNPGTGATFTLTLPVSDDRTTKVEGV